MYHNLVDYPLKKNDPLECEEVGVAEGSCEPTLPSPSSTGGVVCAVPLPDEWEVAATLCTAACVGSKWYRRSTCYITRADIAEQHTFQG